MELTVGAGTAIVRGRSITALLPIMTVVYVAYLVIGVAMPVLPLHVHHALGLGTFVVGLVAGSQFAASLISRLWAGHHADSKGAKHAVVTGLLLATAAGLLYLLSLRFVDAPVTSVSVLLAGRAALGNRRGPRRRRVHRRRARGRAVRRHRPVADHHARQ